MIMKQTNVALIPTTPKYYYICVTKNGVGADRKTFAMAASAMVANEAMFGLDYEHADPPVPMPKPTYPCGDTETDE